MRNKKKKGFPEDEFEMKSLTQEEMNAKLKEIFGNSDLDLAQSLTQMPIKKVKIKKIKAKE